MTDTECVTFLQAALPRMGLDWRGYRRVRHLVCKRLNQRLRELRLPDLAAYRDYLRRHAEEWALLDGCCRIPVSRFYRDAEIFAALTHEVLPALGAAAAAQGRSELACWSACCASGEEPYTLAALWHCGLRDKLPGLTLRVVASDIDAHLLQRARKACYRSSSLKAVPGRLLDCAFVRCGDLLCVREALRGIEFVQQDIRETMPAGLFDCILCRNAVLTYFSAALRLEVMDRIASHLAPGGALVIGAHERLPAELGGFALWPAARSIHRKLVTE